MPYEPFYRLFVTPMLPFTAHGDIDEDGYRHLLRRFLTPAAIDAGMAIVANPEAGELFTLDRDERRRVLELTVEEVAGRVPIVAGVAHVTTAGVVDTARDAADAGVDGLFVFPPMGASDITLAWNGNEYPEVFVDILRAITAEVDLPQVIHPVSAPSMRYGCGFSSALTRRVLDEIPHVIGWKMTYNYDGYREITRVIRSLDRPVALLGAVASYFHENLAAGAFDGTSSGSFNYALEPMLEHIAAWRDGDVARATEIWNSGLAELHEYVYSDYGRLHVRYKAAAWLRGFIANPLMRPPMPRPRREEIETLQALLRQLDISVIDQREIDEGLALAFSARAGAAR